MALQTGSLAEACGPFQIKDEGRLAEVIDGFREENPGILEDLELVVRGTGDFMQARGLLCRGTVEGTIDYEDEALRRVYLRVHMSENTVEENIDLQGELVTRLSVKRRGLERWITVDMT